jgi:hypothetical protein
MSDWHIFEGVVLIVFGLWVASVELRLKAAQILGEIVKDDFKERGLIEK